MKNSSRFSLFLCCLTFSVVLFSVTDAIAARKPVFEKIFPAKKQGEAILSIKKWGRYTIVAKSEEGSAIQLIDRKIGLRKRDGTPGEKSGRIDEFLDVGEYKIIVSPHQDGKSSTKLQVFPFEELNTETPQYLTPIKEYKLSLRDGEQVSYWIYVERDTSVFIEALGRNVADVQLWLNGDWRVDLQRESFEAYPGTDTPLKGYRIVQRLSAGYYLLTMYGGQEQPWARKSNEHPAFVQMYLPRLPATGSTTLRISEKGYTSFYASQKLKAVICALPKKKLTFLRLCDYPFGNLSASNEQLDSIHEKSADPRCIIRSSSNGSNGRLVQVSGTPGDTVTLQTFEQVLSSFSVPEDGNYWFSTLHSGNPDDQLGVMGIVVHSSANDKIINEKIIRISDKEYFDRTFNLLDNMSLLLFVDASGKYDFVPSGTDMEIRVQRLLASNQNSVKSLDPFTAKTTLQLEPGYYRCSIAPKQKGIATLQINKSSIMQMIKDAVGMKQSGNSGSQNIQFPALSLSKGERYLYLSNSIAPEYTGTILRKLPLSLDEALPVYCEANVPVTVPFVIPVKSQLSVRDGSGKALSCKINGEQKQTPCELDNGQYELIITSDKRTMVTAATIPSSQLPKSPAAPFPTGERSPLPHFPKLQAGEPVYFDLDRNTAVATFHAAVYEFTIATPGMYRFETTGRLATTLSLRDRFVVTLQSEQENGIGRNAMILTYLLPGTYQAQVGTNGQSAGHLGLSLAKNETIDGGTLTTQKELRHEILPNQGIEYTVTVDKTGDYELISQGQSGFYTVRLDDANGWPVVDPLSSGNIAQKLSKGTYHFISIPQSRTTLRVARLTKKELPAVYEGKVPHILPLNASASSIWMEQTDASSKIRIPVKYRITLPAPVRCKCTLSEGFFAILHYDNKKDTLFTVNGSLDTLLPMGILTFDVFAEKPQNSAPYSISVTTDILMAGMLFPVVTNPAKIPVSIGKPGVFEFFSQGTNDVAAVLLKGSEQCAANDDAPNDWNFRITQMLMPGMYTLVVSPAASGSNETMVHMTTLGDTTYAGWEMDTPKTLDMGGKLHRVIVQTTDSSDILHIACKGVSPVSCLVQLIRDNGIEKMCGTSQGTTIALSVAVEPKKKYAVYFWSVDHADESVTIAIKNVTAVPVTISQLLRGVKIDRIADGNAFHSWLKLDFENDSTGHFVVDANDEFTGVKTAYTVNLACKSDIAGGFATLHRIRYATFSFSEGGNKKLRLLPCFIDTPYTVPLEKSPRVFRIETGKKSVSFLTATTKTSIPMCGIRTLTQGTGDVLPAGFEVFAGVTAGRGKACAVELPDDSHQFLVWDALSSVTAASEKEDVTLAKRSIPLDQGKPLNFETRVWNASANRACSIPKDKPTPAVITVLIPRGGIAMWKRPDGSRSTFTTDKLVQSCEFQETAGELILVNPGAAAQFSVTSIALDSPVENRIFTEANGIFRYEEFFETEGTHSIRLPSKTRALGKAHFTADGAVVNIDWWSVSGTIFPSLPADTVIDLTAQVKLTGSSTGGHFTIHHSAGWVKAAISAPKTAHHDWAYELRGNQNGRALSYSQMVTLQSGLNWFTLGPTSDIHLRLQIDAPIVAVLLQNGAVRTTIATFTNDEINLPLTKGAYVLGIRGLGTTSLANVPMTCSLLPILPLTQKEPSKVLFASGDSRMLRFELDTARMIGIGCATDNEVVKTALIDHSLNVISNGQQQFLKLDKGEYFLHCTVSPTDEPAQCTIKLFGQDVPPDEPPADVVNRFIR